MVATQHSKEGKREQKGAGAPVRGSGVARYENGWIKVHRRAVIEDIGDNVICLGLWVTFLALATWKESKIMWQGEQRVLPPGSVVYGISEFSERWGVSKNTVRRWIQYLVSTDRIRNESGTHGSIATICNWEKYQSLENEAERKRNESGTPTEHEVNAGSTPSDPYEEGKKERKKEVILNTGAVAPVSNLPAPKKSRFSDETKNKMRAFIATYSSGYREKYGAPPEGIRDKALVGKLGHWIEHTSEERACQLVQVYLQIDHKWINDSCHDLWQFFRHLNRIGNALATGQDPGGINWAKVFGGAA